MSTMTIQNSHNLEKSGGNNRHEQWRVALQTVGSRLCQAVTKSVKRITQSMYEAQLHRAAIEIDLYRGHYKYVSKNDDDLPIVR